MLFSLLVLGVKVAAFVGAVSQWSRVRPWLTAGILVGAVVLVLSLPGLPATAFFLEPEALAPKGEGERMVHALGPVLRAVITVFSLGGAVVGAALLALAVCTAELALPQSAFPLLLRREGRGRGVLGAFLFGAAAGGATLLAARALGVTESQLVKDLARLFGGLGREGPAIRLAIALPAMVAAAVSEEILFRGVMQRWLTRWLGGNRRAAALAIVIVSVVWAVGHPGNASSVPFKVGQVLLLGLALGWVARRYSVEATIVAHAGLNAVVAVSEILK
jgi:membrane protease YdiL (CAAX protease family)